MYLQKTKQKSNNCFIYEVHHDAKVIGGLSNVTRGKWEFAVNSGKSVEMTGSLWTVRKQLASELPETSVLPDKSKIMTRSHRIRQECRQYNVDMSWSDCMLHSWKEYKNIRYHFSINKSRSNFKTADSIRSNSTLFMNLGKEFIHQVGSITWTVNRDIFPFKCGDVGNIEKSEGSTVIFTSGKITGYIPSSVLRIAI